MAAGFPAAFRIRSLLFQPLFYSCVQLFANAGGKFIFLS
jgi:hypothetical protein